MHKQCLDAVPGNGLQTPRIFYNNRTVNYTARIAYTLICCSLASRCNFPNEFVQFCLHHGIVFFVWLRRAAQKKTERRGGASRMAREIERTDHTYAFCMMLRSYVIYAVIYTIIYIYIYIYKYAIWGQALRKGRHGSFRPRISAKTSICSKYEFKWLANDWR